MFAVGAATGAVLLYLGTSADSATAISGVNEHTALGLALELGQRSSFALWLFDRCLSGPGLSSRHRAAVARELAFGLSFAAAKPIEATSRFPGAKKAPSFGGAGL